MNKSFSKYLFIIIVAFFSCNHYSYGFQNYSFKHYNINNGLSQNTVHSIFQDRHGFMWFGTKDGLNRFDGTSFEIYKFSPDDNLRDNVFRHIIEDNKGNIWVATEGGVYIFNPFLEKFDRLEAKTEDGIDLGGVISDLIQDNDGDIWITIEEKGVFNYNISDEKLLFYPMSLKSEGMRMISACAGSNNDIWIFPYGLSPIRIDKKSGQTTTFQLLDDPYLFEKLGEVTNVVLDGNNQLILPTSNKGVISINILNRTHRVLLDSDSSGNPVFARTVKRIDNSNIWIGSESGIYILNTLEGTVENLKHSSSIPTSLSDNAIYSIFKDSSGGVWVGSYFGGVDYYSEHLNNFELFYPTSGLNNMNGLRVREFCPANDGNIWIGTEDNGLHLFDPKSKQFLSIQSPLNSLYTNIHALHNDGDYLWISTFSKGLNKYDTVTKEIKTYVNSKDSTSISQNSAFSVLRDKSGILWVGTLSGLNIYNDEKDNFTRIDRFKGVSIQDIFEDSEGRIWVSTFSNGLFMFDRKKNLWRSFVNNPLDPTSLPYNKTTSVYQDSKDNIWITTQGGGFCRYVEDDDSFESINSLVGMPNDVIYQVIEGDDYNLWLSTNSGLVCYNPDTKHIRNFTVENGLKTNQFNYKSSLKTDDGNIYFGSLNGFIRFNPTTFSKVGDLYPIFLTSLYINNNLVSPTSENSVVPESIMFLDEVTLAHNQNSIRLEYSLLSYDNQNSHQIIYKLEGFDKDWIISGRENTIVYSNLNPGVYRLLIKQSIDVDDENVRTLIVKIKPPFWKSIWAYLIYFVLFALLFGAVIKYIRTRENNTRKRKMQIFEQEKERELYRSKIDFFTNVAHEIRTPLSLIKAPLDYVLITEDISNEVKDNLMIMSKNTDRLLSLTNQLLDFQKTEAAAYSLNINTQNASKLIRETYLRFTSFAQQRSIEFKISLPDQDIYADLDKEAFLKIISNLLSNAIKYCESAIFIGAHVSNCTDEQRLHIVVENDGEVIPNDLRERVFEPFFNASRDKDSMISGTGIGLALSRSLAELHNGELIIEDKESINRFVLSIPVGKISTHEELSNDNEGSTKVSSINNHVDTAKIYSVLLVDDDDELLTFETKVLSSYYNVYTATNGEDALEILKSTTINLVVSDVMMPIMDGFELTHSIKSNIEFSHIPVILLTAKTNVQSKVEGYESGADSYIEKPFSIEILMAQVANLLQGREKLLETFHKHPFISANSVAFTKSDEDFIKKLDSIVQDNISNTDFVVENIAEHFNMSRASFYRKIKGVLNLTPNEYIRIERLKKAAYLLKENQYKVNEVCYMVGFNSASYFAKCFQKQFGVLPKDF